jgi:hypothetical protein
MTATRSNYFFDFVILPFVVFWVVYIIIANLLLYLKDKDVYKKYFSNYRKSPIGEQRSNAIKINIDKISNTLIMNSIISLIYASLFFYIFGYPDYYQSQKWNLSSDILLICFYFLYRYQPENHYDQNQQNDSTKNNKLNSLVAHLRCNFKKISYDNINKQEIFICSLVILIISNTNKISINNNDSEFYRFLDTLIVDFILKISLSICIANSYFYHIHALMHSNHKLMKYHAQHHQIHHPIALAGLYCSPVEMLIVNMPTILLGPWLVGMNSNVFLLWILGSCLTTLFSHDGHVIEAIGLSSEFHDYHHTHRPYKNFGLDTFWDSLYKTKNENEQS